MSVQRDGGLPQLVLQLRGGAKNRGPQNYAHSVERGIRLADIAAELGSDLAVLAALYPDGVARFWGSTPTNQLNNYKARALRDRRVGDDVLFYADTAFYSRARILHLLHNPAAARQIWGTDDDGQTWEHIMALGDIEPLVRPVPAGPVLRQLGLGVPLRSLTLVGAPEFAMITPLLADAGITPRTPVGSPPRKMTRKRLFKALDRLVDACRGHDRDPSVHGLPLTALWAIGRIASGEHRPASAQELKSGLEPVLERYGAASGDQPGSAEPFWRLRDSGLWDIVGSDDRWEIDPSGFHEGSGSNVSAGHVSSAGFTPAVTALLSEPEVQGRAVVMLSTALAADVDRAALLAEVGLAGYDSASGVLDTGNGAGSGAGEQGPAKRRAVLTERIVRSTAVAERVKRLHGHRCQVCKTRLTTRYGFYSEAAHIRGLGRPHEGPDQDDNVLCLCPNHHVQFDAFAIFIDSDLVVRRTSDGEKIGKLRLHPKHAIGPDHLQYHRRFCGMAD
ncbi:HNH endonuclease [Micromonospora sp. NPDC047620]|uniref:HNH endonuclease n=1 Tax=Micromonospora sp. NPDC047620 TaxID=3364251 RepID=UPI003711F95A